MELARAVAEAEFDLRRVRAAKVAIVNQCLATEIAETANEEAKLLVMSSDPEAKMTSAFHRALPQLTKFDRYERSAVAARNRSLGALVEYSCNKNSRYSCGHKLAIFSKRSQKGFKIQRFTMPPRELLIRKLIETSSGNVAAHARYYAPDALEALLSLALHGGSMARDKSRAQNS